LAKQEIDIFDFYNLKETKIFQTNHQNGFFQSCWINRVLLLENGKFVTCSTDETIRVWNFDKTMPEKVLTGHTSAILNIILLQNGRVCSGSYDGMIKIWNIENATCEKTLLGHSGKVVALLELPDNILISGGDDQIRFWNLQASSDNACLSVYIVSPVQEFFFSKGITIAQVLNIII